VRHQCVSEQVVAPEVSDIYSNCKSLWIKASAKMNKCKKKKIHLWCLAPKYYKICYDYYLLLLIWQHYLQYLQNYKKITEEFEIQGYSYHEVFLWSSDFSHSTAKHFQLKQLDPPRNEDLVNSLATNFINWSTEKFFRYKCFFKLTESWKTSSTSCLMTLLGGGRRDALWCDSHNSKMEFRLARRWAMSSHMLRRRQFRESLSLMG